MQEAQSNKHLDNFDDEIDFGELFNILYQGKWIIVSVTAFILIIGVLYSLRLPNIYESKSLLIPVDSSSDISGALGNYSTLAGIAGINLPSSNDGSNSLKAIQKLSSLSFFENNIMTNIFLPDLMALKSWSPETNTMTYDERIYQKNNNTWVRDYSYPQKQIPSAQESFKVFITEHLSLSEDKKTGLISLSIKHQSPFVAKEWAELLIKEVNNFYRQKDKSQSEKALRYLNQQFAMTGLSEIKQVLAQLLQEETKKLTLIEANQSYVFEYIDPPAVMEKKSEPKRSLIVMLSGLLGGILSIVLVLLKHYVSKERKLSH